MEDRDIESGTGSDYSLELNVKRGGVRETRGRLWDRTRNRKKGLKSTIQRGR